MSTLTVQACWSLYWWHWHLRTNILMIVLSSRGLEDIRHRSQRILLSFQHLPTKRGIGSPASGMLGQMTPTQWKLSCIDAIHRYSQLLSKTLGTELVRSCENRPPKSNISRFQGESRSQPAFWMRKSSPDKMTSVGRSIVVSTAGWRFALVVGFKCFIQRSFGVRLVRLMGSNTSWYSQLFTPWRPVPFWMLLFWMRVRDHGGTQVWFHMLVLGTGVETPEVCKTGSPSVH